MSVSTAIALLLAALSTVLTNLAYLREHDAAAALPVLSMRRPLHSARILLDDRSWVLGFVMETGGFLLYAAALALASLALVQSIAAGGIGVLAYVSARVARRRLSRRELNGVLVSVFGLAALAVSLAGGSGKGGNGSTAAILLWLGVTAGAALVVLAAGRRQGGVRIGFLVTLILGYTLGTALLQVGYQSGSALAVAGIATLLTNAIPIAAGTIVLDEPVPSGALGGLRLFAFAAVTIGAVLLARPKPTV